MRRGGARPPRAEETGGLPPNALNQLEQFLCTVSDALAVFQPPRAASPPPFRAHRRNDDADDGEGYEDAVVAGSDDAASSDVRLASPPPERPVPAVAGPGRRNGGQQDARAVWRSLHALEHQPRAPLDAPPPRAPPPPPRTPSPVQLAEETVASEEQPAPRGTVPVAPSLPQPARLAAADDDDERPAVRPRAAPARQRRLLRGCHKVPRSSRELEAAIRRLLEGDAAAAAPPPSVSQPPSPPPTPAAAPASQPQLPSSAAAGATAALVERPALACGCCASAESAGARVRCDAPVAACPASRQLALELKTSQRLLASVAAAAAAEGAALDTLNVALTRSHAREAGLAAALEEAHAAAAAAALREHESAAAGTCCTCRSRGPAPTAAQMGAALRRAEQLARSLAAGGDGDLLDRRGPAALAAEAARSCSAGLRPAADDAGVRESVESVASCATAASAAPHDSAASMHGGGAASPLEPASVRGPAPRLRCGGAEPEPALRAAAAACGGKRGGGSGGGGGLVWALRDGQWTRVAAGAP